MTEGPMLGLLGGRGTDSATARLAVRTVRRLDQIHTDELVDRIDSLRQEIAWVRGQLGRETVPEVTLGALASALDHTARLITGGERGSRDSGRSFGTSLGQRYA